MTSSTGTEADRPAPGPTTPSAARAYGKRQLRNYLLDRIQIRYTAVIVLISACLTGGLGYLVISKAREATQTASVTVMGSVDDAVQRDQILAQFHATDRMLLIAMVGFGVVLCLILAIYGIVITHKVAGPIYKISTYFTSIRDGRLGPVYNLRKGDQLQEFFEGFKSMHESLRQRAQEDVELLGRAVAVLERSGAQGELAGALEALKTLKRKKEESLG